MFFRYLKVCILILSVIKIQAQTPAYPKNYFRNPLGIPIKLTANFGEIRPDHWHMGLDIRTNQRINLPVYAAAGGYISHIGVRPTSFGQFIVITHPNGLSTLYAHLNKFNPELEAYVEDQQYKQESWALELDPDQKRFPVNKGTLIGYSGNTGGSLGPHLHFEIIDTKTTKRLNPQLFNMPVPDIVAPTIVRLGMYDRSISVYEQTPGLFTLKRSGNNYSLPVIKTGFKKVSFAIQAYDKVNGGGSPNGIYSAMISIDGRPLEKFILDSIDYDETGYINAQVDYKYAYNGSVSLQHLSKMPGDKGPVYKNYFNDGVIDLRDTMAHRVEIRVTDANNNTAMLNFSMQYDADLSPSAKSEDYSAKIIPNSMHLMGKPGFEMLFGTKSIYDTVYPAYTRTDILNGEEVSFAHTAGDPSIPLHDNVTIRIKPDKPVPFEWKQKIVIQKTAKEKMIRKATWNGDWMEAKFGGFGTYQAIADILPPIINNPGNFKGDPEDTINLSAEKRIVFTPKDNFDVIKNFRAELDGKWLRFTNDKRKNWIYQFDEHCPYGIHNLKVTIEDLAGNVTVKNWWFKRYPYTAPPKRAPVRKTSTKKKSSAKKN